MAAFPPNHSYVKESGLLLIEDPGIITCPGIFPTVFTILWRRQSKAAAILAPILGMVTGLAVWLGTAHAFYGVVTVASTGEVLPCVYGTVAAALAPTLYSVIITLLRPQNYNWDNFAKERLAFGQLDEDLTTVDSGHVSADPRQEEGTVATDRQDLKRWGRIATIWSLATFLGHWVIWPLPMYAADYVFGRLVCAHHLHSPTLLPTLAFKQYF